MRTELRKQIEELFPRPIFVIDKLHPAAKCLTCDGRGLRIDPRAGDFPPDIARRDPNRPGTSNALRLSGISRGIDIQRGVARFRREPDRGSNALPALAKALEIQIALVLQSFEAAHREPAFRCRSPVSPSVRRASQPVEPSGHHGSMPVIGSAMPASLRGAQRRSNLLPDERNSVRQAGDCFGAARLAMTQARETVRRFRIAQ